MLRMPHLPLMQWDFRDQLHGPPRSRWSTTAARGERTYYVYDAAGQRVRKVTERPPGKRPRRAHLPRRLRDLPRVQNGGRTRDVERETLHIMDDKQRIALVETRTQGNDGGSPAQLIRYQFGNHLGSASLELDDQAQIISYEEYTPYGSTSYQAVRSQTETPKRYRYTGKERDEEGGFTTHGGRGHGVGGGGGEMCDAHPLRECISLQIYEKKDPRFC